MKFVKFLLTLIAVGLVFVFGFGYGRWYSTRPAEAKNARKILYYVDSMHPWYKSDKPGIAPDCGMKLEPVYAGEAPPAGDGGGPPPNTMLVGQDKQQLIGLKYGQPEWITDGQTIHASGRVVPDGTQVSRVHSKVEGWIEQVTADFNGQMVRKGQPLLTLYSPELLASQQELLLALKAKSMMSHSSLAEASINSDSMVEATRRRLELWDLKDEQVAEIERTGKPVKSITVYSPASGYITGRNAFPGQKIVPETELYTITDLSRVWILADVFESDAPQVHAGQNARVMLPGAGVLNARVAYLQPQMDPATRTLKVRLETPNTGMRLRPDEFVEVEMQVGTARRLMVPADAVLDSGTTKTVFVDLGNGYFEPRRVETGQRIGDRVEILKGLTPDDRIVTSGAFLLNSESQIKAAEKRP